MKGNSEMHTSNTKKRSARIAGLIYLSSILLGAISVVLIGTDVSVSGGAPLNLDNILSAGIAVRLGYTVRLIVYVCFLIIANLLYEVFESTNKGLARLMVLFIVVAVPIVFTDISSCEMVAAIFFGLWLFPLGLLILKSGLIPKIIGWLLFIACFCHVANFFIFFILPDHSANLDTVLSSLASVGEIPLMLWLLIKGVTERPSNKCDTVEYSA
jgi:hypothetical protein